MNDAPPEASFRTEELLADAISRLIGGARHVAVGMASPLAATAALVAQARGNGRPYVTVLQSRTASFFVDGGRELFDCAGQGRLDVVVHNAGHMVLGPAEAFTPQQLADLYDINVLSTQRVNRAALPHLRARGEGLLVWTTPRGSG